ncbi:MAG: sodium:calcium antiporter [Candidatus Kariarchaeaceae archaeon]|jgi:cation:H+ antiporter
MSLLIAIFTAIGLLIVIGIASEFLAKGAEILETKFGAGFTGSVVLGFITMLPELIFVLVAVNEMKYDIALGSAVGGNILLFTIGYGIVILTAYFKHNEVIKLPKTIKDDLWYLFIATIYLLISSLSGSFGLIDGIILFTLYFVFVIHQYIETKSLKEEKHEKIEYTRRIWLKNGSYMLIGAIGILLAAEPFVHAIIDISHETGVSAIVLALIISPLASELPEKISAFVLASRSLKGAEIAVANFIGSKVQASTLLFGSMILFKRYLDGGNFEVGENFVQILLAVLTTLVGIWITYDLKLKLKEGVLVVFLYFVCIVAVFFV